MILALDFGGTKHSAAVLMPDGASWLAHRRHVVAAGADAAGDLDTMLALARDLLAGRRPRAIGVSFGGPVDHAAGRVRLSHHVPGWEDLPLAEFLAHELGAPAAVDNDANAAALGEHRYGAGRGMHSLLYVTVSTGVGGGWMLGGQIWRGADGMAGEIGHMMVDPAGPFCLCGKRGCVERLASGPYMARALRERWQAEGRPLPETMSGRTVAEAAAQGDAAASAVLERGAWALGVALGNAANLINPQRLILGGGVTGAGDRWWSAVRRAVRETALPQVQFEVVPAALGDDAPLWGAAALALELRQQVNDSQDASTIGPP